MNWLDRALAGLTCRSGKTFSSRAAQLSMNDMRKNPDAIEEAEKAGIDLHLIDDNLAMTPDERARSHDRALVLVLELNRIRRERDAQSSPAPRPAD